MNREDTLKIELTKHRNAITRLNIDKAAKREFNPWYPTQDINASIGHHKRKIKDCVSKLKTMEMNNVFLQRW